MLIPESDRKPAAAILTDDVKYHFLAAVTRFLRAGVVTALNHRMNKVEAREAKRIRPHYWTDARQMLTSFLIKSQRSRRPRLRYYPVKSSLSEPSLW